MISAVSWALAGLLGGPGLRVDPPLGPSGEEARSLLRRELLHPEYHQQNIVERILVWLGRLLDRGINAASGLPPLSTFAGMVVLLALLLALGWLVSRARRTARAVAPGSVVLTGERITAAQLRSRAEEALARGRHADALVDGFRALTVRQVEHGRLDERPGATAHEVADALASAYPLQSAWVDESARLFDLVLYGERPATLDQATEVLRLDDALASLR